MTLQRSGLVWMADFYFRWDKRPIVGLLPIMSASVLASDADGWSLKRTGAD